MISYVICTFVTLFRRYPLKTLLRLFQVHFLFCTIKLDFTFICQMQLENTTAWESLAYFILSINVVRGARNTKLKIGRSLVFAGKLWVVSVARRKQKRNGEFRCNKRYWNVQLPTTALSLFVLVNSQRMCGNMYGRSAPNQYKYTGIPMCILLSIFPYSCCEHRE